MRRIWSWYLRYVEAVERLLNRLGSTQAGAFTIGFLFLLGMGIWTGWEPYRALAHGASLLDTIALTGKMGPYYTSVWSAAFFPTLMVLGALAIPVWLVFAGAESVHSIEFRERTNPPRRKRRMAAGHTRKVHFRFPLDPERLWWTVVVALFAGVVLFPLWRAIEALSAGAGISDNVNISPWYPTASLPVWTVFIYTLAMLYLGRRAITHILTRPAR